MKIKLNQIVFLLAFNIYCFSCVGQQIDKNENIEDILNVVLKEYDSIYLIKETYYCDSSIKPIHALYPYYRVYNSKKNSVAFDVFYKKVEDIISLIELDRMKKKYNSWSLPKWIHGNIKNKSVQLISLDSVNEYHSSIPIVRLSEPLFTKDKKKAIIYKFYSKNNSGTTGVSILVRNNGNWKLEGWIPIGTSG